MVSFSEVAKYSGLKRTAGFNYYFQSQVFPELSLRDKTMLDIGGGNGLASYWALLAGGCLSSIIVDPFDDGSNHGMLKQFNDMKSISEVNDRIKLFNGTLGDLRPDNERFDIALMHNSVNHIDEDATRLLPDSEDARKCFYEQFKLIHRRLKKGGKLIIADCSNKNLFGDIRLKNPFAPTINWESHQAPGIWRAVVEPCGFVHLRTTWTSRREFGRLGFALFGNPLGAYMTTSHFVLEFRALSMGSSN